MKRLGMIVVVALAALAIAAPSAPARTERQQDAAITKLKRQVRVLTTRVNGLGGPAAAAAALESRTAALEAQAAGIVARASALEAYVVTCLSYGAYGVAQFSDFQSYYGGYTTGLDYATGPDFYALAVNPACLSSSSAQAQASALADEASDLRWHVKLLRAGSPR